MGPLHIQPPPGTRFMEVFGNQVWAPHHTCPPQFLSCSLCPLSLIPTYPPWVLSCNSFPLVPKCPPGWDQGTFFLLWTDWLLSLAISLEILSFLIVISILARSVRIFAVTNPCIDYILAGPTDGKTCGVGRLSPACLPPLWQVSCILIYRLQAGGPGKPVVVSVQAWRPENPGSHSTRPGPSAGEYWCSAQVVSQSEQILSSSTFFFYSSPQRIGWCPPKSGRAICFTKSTNSNANFTQKLPHRHTQK